MEELESGVFYRHYPEKLVTAWSIIFSTYHALYHYKDKRFAGDIQHLYVKEKIIYWMWDCRTAVSENNSCPNSLYKTQQDWH